MKTSITFLMASMMMSGAVAHAALELLPTAALVNAKPDVPMAVRLAVTAGKSEMETPPTSDWNYNLFLVDPEDGVGRLDRLYIKVAGPDEAGDKASDLRLNSANFGTFCSGDQVLEAGEGEKKMASLRDGTPSDGMVPGTPVWVAITDSDTHDCQLAFNDLALGLLWEDANGDGKMNHGDTLHILGVVYSTGEDRIAGSVKASSLSELVKAQRPDLVYSK